MNTDLKRRFATIECTLGDTEQKSYVDSRHQKDDHLLPKICKQIEFYLGDANLAHDKYFRRLLEQNQQYVPLESFLGCNKIKRLMQNYPRGHSQQVAILAHALKRSSILKLDSQEKRVRRRINLCEDSAYLDARTIYIENLPQQVDNGLLHQIFTNIDQHILQVKMFDGYGFVTFLNEDSVGLAIEKYQNFVPKEVFQIVMRGGLRVMRKTEWLRHKEETKLLIRQLKQASEVNTGDGKIVKLVGVDMGGMRVEEARIAVHHVVDPRDVLHVNINHGMYFIQIHCRNEEAAYRLLNGQGRLQNYDDRFKKCYII